MSDKKENTSVQDKIKEINHRIRELQLEKENLAFRAYCEVFFSVLEKKFPRSKTLEIYEAIGRWQRLAYRNEKQAVKRIDLEGRERDWAMLD